MNVSFNSIKKIFIASSSELKRERDVLSLLIYDLGEHCVRQNQIKLNPIRWEESDASVSHRFHKNDDYIAFLDKCELFFAMFDEIIGEYTIRELNAAMKSGKICKVVVFIKNYSQDKEDAIIKQFENDTSLRSRVHFIQFRTEAQLKLQAVYQLSEYLASQYRVAYPLCCMDENAIVIADEIIIEKTGLDDDAQRVLGSFNQV